MDYGSKISDKIEIITTWRKKYPQVSIVPKINRFYFQSHIDSLDDLDKEYERYEKIISYYVYLRARYTQGKLKENEIKKIKEANIGGIFGYSKEVEKLVKMYGINAYNAIYIVEKYGTIEKFYSDIKTKKDNYENYLDNDTNILGQIVKSTYDIDLSDNSDNYNTLIEKKFCFNKGINYNLDLFIYSSKNIDKYMEDSMSEYQRKIIRLKYGLDDGIPKTIDEIASILNVTSTRVKQIEERAIRSLRLGSNIVCDFEKVLSILEISKEEKEELKKLDLFIRTSKNKNNKVRQATDIIRNFILDKNNKFKKEEKNKKQIDKSIIEKCKMLGIKEEDASLEIKNLNISTRLRTALLRANIKYLGELLMYDFSKPIRGLGKTSYEEIRKVLCSLGYILLNDRINNDKINNSIHEIEAKDIKNKFIEEYKLLKIKLEKVNELKDYLEKQTMEKEKELRKLGYIK